jgi:hypothetical protein
MRKIEFATNEWWISKNLYQYLHPRDYLRAISRIGARTAKACLTSIPHVFLCYNSVTKGLSYINVQEGE